MGTQTTKVAILDDWQGVARSSTDWSPLTAIADVVFFGRAFENEDDAANSLADFDIVLSMRERTPLPGSLIDRLPKLRMLGITGSSNRSLDVSACTARGVVVCNTGERRKGRYRRVGSRFASGRGARHSRSRRKNPRRTFSRRIARWCQPGRKNNRHCRSWKPRLLHGPLLPGTAHACAGMESKSNHRESPRCGSVLGLEG